MFEELDDLFAMDGLVEDLKIEVPKGNTGDDRNGLPVKVKLQNWRLPPRRPSSPSVRPLTQPTFVDKDDRAAFLLSFFLISGQRLRFQSSIRDSFRSSARPTGC